MTNITRKESNQLSKQLFVEMAWRLAYELYELPKKGRRAQEYLIKTPTGDKIIQLRSRKDSQSNYVLSKEAESLKLENHFYVFVNGGKNPTFRIVPSKVVAEKCRKNHEEWLKGQPKIVDKRKDTTMRKFYDDEGIYLNAWNLLN